MVPFNASAARRTLVFLLGLKMNLISKYQLAGAAFWKLGSEPASVWDVCKISDK